VAVRYQKKDEKRKARTTKVRTVWRGLAGARAGGWFCIGEVLAYGRIKDAGLPGRGWIAGSYRTK